MLSSGRLLGRPFNRTFGLPVYPDALLILAVTKWLFVTLTDTMNLSHGVMFVGPITRRSLVRIQPPLPRIKKAQAVWSVLFVYREILKRYYSN